MSIYFYLVCERHRESCPAASSVGGGTPLTDSDVCLSPFLFVHQGCVLRVVSEDRDEALDACSEWDAENKEAMREAGVQRLIEEQWEREEEP